MNTLPYSWYSDEEQLRRERAGIFARTWQYAGRAEEVAANGSVLATNAGGVPIVVTRDDDGRAACVPQRVPPSRRGARRGLRDEERDPVPLPRLDL